MYFLYLYFVISLHLCQCTRILYHKVISSAYCSNPNWNDENTSAPKWWCRTVEGYFGDNLNFLFVFGFGNNDSRHEWL